tara:strand:- start:6444 stop:6638 length:195 start_codon:yes stop_codon:yes gene_type:complete
LATLRREVAELCTLPARNLALHEQMAADKTPNRPPAKQQERPRASDSPLNFADLVQRMEARQRH